MLKPFQLYYNLRIGFQDFGCHIDNHVWLLSVCAMQCKGRIATYKKITSICNGWIEIAWLSNILCTSFVRLSLHYLLCYYEFFWRFLCNLIGMSRSLWFERGSSFSFQNSKMNMGFCFISYIFFSLSFPRFEYSSTWIF